MSDDTRDAFHAGMVAGLTAVVHYHTLVTMEEIELFKTELELARVRIDNDSEMSLLEFLTVNGSSPLDPIEILNILDLNLGGKLTFGGGAMAETVVERIE
jgi:hypothetical protein